MTPPCIQPPLRLEGRVRTVALALVDQWWHRDRRGLISNSIDLAVAPFLPPCRFIWISNTMSVHVKPGMVMLIRPRWNALKPVAGVEVDGESRRPGRGNYRNVPVSAVMTTNGSPPR